MAIIARARQGLSIFELIKPALDELYAGIQGTDAQKDAAIKYRIETLRQRYKGLAAGEKIDYADNATRFAYMYGHVTSHARYCV